MMKVVRLRLTTYLSSLQPTEARKEAKEEEELKKGTACEGSVKPAVSMSVRVLDRGANTSRTF